MGASHLTPNTMPQERTRWFSVREQGTLFLPARVHEPNRGSENDL